MTFKFIIVCNNISCDKYRHQINSFYFDCSSPEEYVEFLEGYGYGSEENEDVCKSCNCLGEIAEIEELT